MILLNYYAGIRSLKGESKNTPKRHSKKFARFVLEKIKDNDGKTRFANTEF